LLINSYELSKTVILFQFFITQYMFNNHTI